MDETDFAGRLQKGVFAFVRGSAVAAVGRFHGGQAERLLRGDSGLWPGDRRERSLHAGLRQSWARVHDGRRLYARHSRISTKRFVSSPPSRITISSAGLVYEKKGKKQEAADSFATAIKFNDKNVHAYRHAATALAALGHNDLATEYRGKADALAPPTQLVDEVTRGGLLPDPRTADCLLCLAHGHFPTAADLIG